MGFPISNDPRYGHPCWRAGGGREQVLEVLMRARLASEEGEHACGAGGAADSGDADSGDADSGAAAVFWSCR